MFLAGAAFNSLIHVSDNGSFEWKGVPPGNYYVALVGDSGANADWYLKSMNAGGRDSEDSSISVSGGAIALDLGGEHQRSNC